MLLLTVGYSVLPLDGYQLAQETDYGNDYFSCPESVNQTVHVSESYARMASACLINHNLFCLQFCPFVAPYPFPIQNKGRQDTQKATSRRPV